jgi:hypothetical protein
MSVLIRNVLILFFICSVSCDISFEFSKFLCEYAVAMKC